MYDDDDDSDKSDVIITNMIIILFSLLQIIFAAVCSLVGQMWRVLLARRAYHMLEGEGEGSVPVRDVGFSPLVCHTD